MGLSPYDKKSYKESKRRRRQAMLADETGLIMPFKRRRKTAFIILIAILSAAAAAASGFAVYHAFFQPEGISYQSGEAPEHSELLRIVNRQFPLEEDYEPALESIMGVKVNVLAYDSLKAMSEKAGGQGIELKLNSAYVSYSQQQEMYERALEQFRSNPDYTEVRAQAAARKLVSEGGCSEAQTGLLVDFEVSDVETQAFIERNCVSFGFVLRYPEDKQEITHCVPSNSLYRYVGADNAIKLRSYNMCLEEYAEYLSEYGQ